MAERTASVERNTLETQIKVSINLDGSGKATFDTGVPFFEHMLEQIARHGLIDLDIFCKGDLHIDDHHTVEDVGITLGQAFAKAVGDKKGMTRYGHSYVPLDEALLENVEALATPLTDKHEDESMIKALDSLTADYAMPLRLKFLDEMPLNRIAAFMGLPLSTVKWRLHHGKKLLRTKVEEPG